MVLAMGTRGSGGQLFAAGHLRPADTSVSLTCFAGRTEKINEALDEGLPARHGGFQRTSSPHPSTPDS
jgi:hypothetical protein